MKQLVPSGLDEYIAEHKEGDLVTGRMVEVSDGSASVDSARESVYLAAGRDQRSRREKAPKKFRIGGAELRRATKARSVVPGFNAAGAMERWNNHQRRRTGGRACRTNSKFRIAKLDASTKKIELELAQNQS